MKQLFMIFMTLHLSLNQAVANISNASDIQQIDNTIAQLTQEFDEKDRNNHGKEKF